MNILVQMCGIFVIVTLLIFYILQRKLYLHTEKVFLTAMIVTLFTQIFDIFSLYTITHRAQLSTALINNTCKIYLLTLIYSTILVHVYIGMDIMKTKKDKYLNNTFDMAMVIISFFLIMFSPIEFYYDGTSAYSYGNAVIVTYAIILFYIFLVIARILFYHKRINADRRISVIIWMALWVFGALIQYFNPSLLIVSFFDSLGMMILYIKLENPGMNIDKASGLFNQHAFLAYVRQHYLDHKRFSLYYIELDSFVNRLYGKDFEWERIDSLLPVKETFVFRRSENKIILAFEYYDHAKGWEDAFMERLKDMDDINSICLKKALWIKIYDSTIFADENDLFYFLKSTMLSQHEKNFGDFERQVVVNKNSLVEISREKKMDALLTDALLHDKIEVFFQPIYSNEKQAFTSAEALVRLRDENGKIVPPMEFIPIAEKSGKILELGKAVFEKVCAFLNKTDICDYGIEYIEVNLSAVQCSDERLAVTCIETMEKHGIKPSQINLEITESASLKYKDIFLENLNTLRDYGVTFSLDDFGTGESNLNYIVDIPVDIVKFDRSMTTAYFNNEKASYVMEAAIHMIHGMQLKIVSEGIETEEQFKTMGEIGIAYIQGYFFSKPLPENEFYNFIKQNHVA